MRQRRLAPLAETTIAITGAGSGIGRALARRLSAYGCAVAIVDANAQTLSETESLLDGPSLARPLDVRDSEGQFAFAAEVAEWAPAPIGAVFNNAGVAMTASVAATPPEDHEWLMRINFEGVVKGTRAFLPVLLRQGSGAIVNTSSVFGLGGIPTPERAAEIIHRGVDAGRARILIGIDAYLFDALTRIAPTNYYRVLGAA